MKNLKRNIAVTSTVAILAAVGIGGTVAAQAATDSPTQSVAQADGEVDDATETNDGPDEGNQGPDANPNEPGHQDADESGEAN